MSLRIQSPNGHCLRTWPQQHSQRTIRAARFASHTFARTISVHGVEHLLYEVVRATHVARNFRNILMFSDMDWKSSRDSMVWFEWRQTVSKLCKQNPSHKVVILEV